MGTFHEGMDEYRWSYIDSTQGHYPLHKNLQNALLNAKKQANASTDAVIVQKWKPKGKTVYIIKPTWMKYFSKKTLISYYNDRNMDISFVRKKNYILK